MMTDAEIRATARAEFDAWAAGDLKLEDAFERAVKAGVALAAKRPELPFTTALTGMQRKLLIFIEAYIAAHGIAPTYAEMARATGQKSNGRIAQILDDLETRRAIARQPGMRRGIELLARAVNPAVEAAL